MTVEPILRLGIVGLGMAGAGMVPAVIAHPGMVLAGVAEPDPILRKRFAANHNVEANTDVTQLVRRSDIDAVYIATPHQFHCSHAVAAVEHGKHVIVEKPMALTMPECETMIAAARRANVTLIVGHTHSFDPAIRTMRELIQSGRYGRLTMIAQWNYTDFLYRPRRPEELDTARGGGILFNQIPHQIDIARYLAGTPLRGVRGVTGILDPIRPTEGSCMALLDFTDGVAASIVYSGYDHFDSDEFHGWIGEIGQEKHPRHGASRKALRALSDTAEEARVRAEHYGYPGIRSSDVDDLTKRHQPHFGTLIVTCEAGDLRQSADGILAYCDDGLHEVKIPARAGVAGRDEVLTELYDAVFKGIAPPHDGTFAKGTVAACLALLQSARERREILL